MPKQREQHVTERPPIVTIMGHIDHGKSTLLDYIRNTNIVDQESGGITQRLSAYEVMHTTGEKKGKTITFLDTPGHEAFAAMRSRGARAADVVILVVSAEDGVKEQTLEALTAIKKAAIPYVVAITKIDKPQANVEKAKQSLSEHEVYVEGYGGEIPCVSISAKSGEGVDDLLDMVLLVAELEELTADAKAPGSGVVIESHVDPKKGTSATLIITNGTLKSGMFIAAGKSTAPVRIMEDFMGRSIKTASFSSPVRIVGFSDIPEVGSPFGSYATKKEAEEEVKRNVHPSKADGGENIVQESTDDHVVIPVVVKADVLGCTEAIVHELAKLQHDRAIIKVVHSGVGAISENDVRSAGVDPRAVVIGFNVRVESTAQELADRAGISIGTFDVIYKATEWFEEHVKRVVPKITVEVGQGLIKILKIFSKAKDKQVVGGEVESGTISLGDTVKVMRRDAEIGRGKILELQQQKVAAQKIDEGNQCGLQVQSKVEIAAGDRLEAIGVVEQ